MMTVMTERACRCDISTKISTDSDRFATEYVNAVERLDPGVGSAKQSALEIKYN